MGKEAGCTEIQSILYDVFTTLGFDDETEDDDSFGGDLEFGLTFLKSLRLANRHFWIHSDGRVRFSPRLPEPTAQAQENVGCTEVQNMVHNALEAVGFQFHEDRSGRMGGPHEFSLPQKAATRLRRTNILVSADGTVEFEH